MWFGISLAGLLLSGCAPKAKPMLPQPPPIQADPWGTVATGRRIHQLAKDATQLASDAHALQGDHTAAEHSRIVQRVFTDLLAILPRLQSLEDNRPLAEKLRIIQDARAQLASGSADISMLPTIDGALRAADDALADISRGDNFQEADYHEQFDIMRAQINNLDFVHDPPLHRVDVTQIINIMSQVVAKMSDSLSARLTAETPATQPETQPETQPATQPTTQPTTKP
jgi:outer membrane murein-binding lipoprotein Lpp